MIQGIYDWKVNKKSKWMIIFILWLERLIILFSNVFYKFQNNLIQEFPQMTLAIQCICFYIFLYNILGLGMHIKEHETLGNSPKSKKIVLTFMNKVLAIMILVRSAIKKTSRTSCVSVRKNVLLYFSNFSLKIC